MYHLRYSAQRELGRLSLFRRVWHGALQALRDCFVQVTAKQGMLGWLVVLKWKDADRHGTDWFTVSHSERIVQSLPLFCQGGATTV